MSEDIEVLIRKYKSKIRELRRKLKATEKQMKEIAKLYPDKTEDEIMRIDPWYRGFYYSRLAFLKWIGEYENKLKELMMRLKVFEFRITFSIETERSHGKNIVTVAEVTASTLCRRLGAIRRHRIVNACLKLFWIIFDAFKDLTKDKRILVGSEIYDDLMRRVRFVQRRAKRIREEYLDKIISDMIRYMGSFVRPREEYFTHQSIIKIGIEELAPSEDIPKYPRVKILIEKKEPSYYSRELTVRISRKTAIDILELLEMRMRKRRKK
jgi:hypothetical protein